MKKIYKKCQVFTPQEYASHMLDLIDYKKNLFGKRILENSCGNGAILKEIVKRYISSCLSSNMSLDKIKKGLENDIIGIEIDFDKYIECINELDIVARDFNITNIKWNIINSDTLKTSFNFKFDYIVGNPPYLSYKDMNNEDREFVKMNFSSCKVGKFDYCYAFIEDSILRLNEKGKMAYLIPNSIFKNVFANKVRELILPHLVSVYDNYPLKVFPDAIVSPSIIFLDKDKYVSSVEYYDETEKKINCIDKKRLNGKWVFNDFNNVGDKKFSKDFIISNSIATLLNKCFVIGNILSEDDKFIYIKDFKIEKGILKKATSPKTLKNNKKEHIIFPYFYDDKNKIHKIKEEDLKNKYPNAYKYLESWKDKLLLRDIKNVEWYEYGRTQALKNMNCEKLMISIMVTDEVKVYKLDKETIPYSGIYIIPLDHVGYEKATQILQSEKFLNYVKAIGINSEGNTKRITCNDIKNYYI